VDDGHAERDELEALFERGAALQADLMDLDPDARQRALDRLSPDDYQALKFGMALTEALLLKDEEAVGAAIVELAKPKGPDERALLEAKVRATLASIREKRDEGGT
jgi:hypothetical protein